MLWNTQYERLTNHLNDKRAIFLALFHSLRKNCNLSPVLFIAGVSWKVLNFKSCFAEDRQHIIFRSSVITKLFMLASRRIHYTTITRSIVEEFLKKETIIRPNFSLLILVY